jgi:hypothetical protein
MLLVLVFRLASAPKPLYAFPHDVVRKGTHKLPTGKITLQLGDPHNFGRRVHVATDGSIIKPRSLAWESIFLSKTSSIRNLISNLANEQSEIDPLGIFPQISFYFDNKQASSGRVEYLKTFNDNLELNEDDFSHIGASIGAIAWFGINDLHFDNIVFGLDSDHHLIFGPIDIEGALENFLLLSQTLLIPANKHPIKAYGLKKIEHYARTNVGAVSALVHGYISSFDFLDRSSELIFSEIFKLFEDTSLPIRRYLRSTAEYIGIQNGSLSPLSLSQPLCVAELTQLNRGDVPYFISFINDENIYELDIHLNAVKVDLPNKFVLAKMSTIPRRFGSNLDRPHISTLRTTGALQIAQWLDRKIDFQSIFRTTNILFTSDYISLGFKNSETVRVKRSVYCLGGF